ncbi:hypothetical protein [Mesorhizobium sp. J18]|uniref:hypothetical protein n=1 Tax=Mesorhizobium sp. J18 TaxID=935263 RepID=UPI001FF03983|nr:hypothetical protein [Mesorhizobium sp. J18]
MRADTEIDGSLVTVARGLYRAGMELDPDSPPRLDPATHYNNYVSVPVRFSGAKAVATAARPASERQ